MPIVKKGVFGNIIAAMRTHHLLSIAAAAACAVACGSPDAGKPAQHAPPAAAPAAPAAPPKVRVYVTNEWSGDLTVINADTQTAIGTYKLGKRPRGIQASPDGKSLYVALSGSPPAPPGVDEKTLPPPDRTADGIGEIDADTYQVKRVIHAGNDPEQLDISADGKRLYVANEDAAQTSVMTLLDVAVAVSAAGALGAVVSTFDEPSWCAPRS